MPSCSCSRKPAASNQGWCSRATMVSRSHSPCSGWPAKALAFQLEPGRLVDADPERASAHKASSVASSRGRRRRSWQQLAAPPQPQLRGDLIVAVEGLGTQRCTWPPPSRATSLDDAARSRSIPIELPCARRAGWTTYSTDQEPVPLESFRVADQPPRVPGHGTTKPAKPGRPPWTRSSHLCSPRGAWPSTWAAAAMQRRDGGDVLLAHPAFDLDCTHVENGTAPAAVVPATIAVVSGPRSPKGTGAGRERAPRGDLSRQRRPNSPRCATTAPSSSSSPRSSRPSAPTSGSTSWSQASSPPTPTPRRLAAADSQQLEAAHPPDGLLPIEEPQPDRDGGRSGRALRRGGPVRALEELTTLPGVGRKTANVIRSVAFGLPGLPVDTHVGRLSRRLGLTSERDPVKVEADLCRLLPPDASGGPSVCASSSMAGRSVSRAVRSL